MSDDPDLLLRCGARTLVLKGVTLPAEIRWTRGVLKGDPFVKVQVWKRFPDGRWHYVETPLMITIRGGELDDVIDALMKARDSIKGARSPRARPPRHEAPSAEDIERAKRIERGED